MAKLVNKENVGSSADKRYLERYGEKLSRSTRRARWINNPHEHEERQGQTLATRNREVIRQWAENRRAKPATVAGTEKDGGAGVLRFDFPGYGGKDLKEIGWEDWFSTFEKRNLVFLYQEHLKEGKPSNFFRLDNPEREDA